MEESQIIDALAALAQPTRLQTFRLLVAGEPEGLAAGALAKQQGVPQNTLSAHLAILTRAGLVSSLRQGRSIIYRADLDRIRAIVTFLLQDCCGGNAALCAPIVAALTPCCTPATPASGSC